MAKLLIPLLAVAVLVGILAVGCGEREDPGEALYDRAKAAYENEEYDSAAELCDRVILDYPESEFLKKAEKLKLDSRRSYLFERSKDLANSGRFDAAGELLVELSSIAGDDVKSNYGIGWIYLQMGNAAMAETGYAHPSVRMDLAMMSVAYMDLAKYRFERCVELDEDNSYGHKGLGLYYYSKGELDEALKHIDAAVKKAEGDTEKISTRGLRVSVLVQKEDLEGAKADIDKMAEAFPGRGEVYLSLAEYHLKKDPGDLDKPLEAVNTGLGKKVEDPITKGRMLSVKAQLLAGKGDFEAAVTALREALEIDPLNQNYLDSYTFVYAQAEYGKK